MRIKKVSKRPLLAAALSALLCGYAAIGQTASAAEPAAAMSVQAMIRQADFSDVLIAPDGKHYAALVPNNEEPYENMLAVFDAQTHKPVSVIRSGHNLLFTDYLWANANRLVASVGMHRGGLDRPVPTGELLAFNADGNAAVDLFGFRSKDPDVRKLSSEAGASPISNEPAIAGNILIEVEPFSLAREGVTSEARLLNVYDGRETRVAESPTRNATLYADHAGKLRFAYAYGINKNTLWRYNGRTDAHTGHQAGAAAKDWQLVNDPAVSHKVIVPIGFNRDNTALYVRIDEGKAPASIGRYDVASGQLTVLFQGTFADPGELLPTADGKDYYAVISEDGKKSLHYFDENAPEARTNRALADNFPGQLAYFSSFSRDGKRAIVTVISDRNAGEYYVFDLDTHNAAFLMAAQAWLDPGQLRPMQPIVLNARDGLSLHGFLTLPAGNKPFPLVVLPHGGPISVSDTWDYDEETQLFASRGYAVLRVDYRGSGGHGVWFENLGYRQWGLSMQDDLTDATRWAIAQGYADAGRICIYGSSYGGYAALEGTVREPDLYQCAIGYDGTYDLRVQLSKSDTEKTDLGDEYLRAALGEDPADLLHRSPLAGVSRIKASILLLHGEDDERTPYASFLEFTHALDQQHKPYQTLVEPREGHGFYLPAHRLKAYETMLDFLDRNIGAARTGSTASPAKSH